MRTGVFGGLLGGDAVQLNVELTDQQLATYRTT